MATLIRTLVYLILLIVLGLGIRLMYYGLETVVGSSPHYGWVQVLLLLAGVAMFVIGMVTGVVFLGPRSSPRA